MWHGTGDVKAMQHLQTTGDRDGLASMLACQCTTTIINFGPKGRLAKTLNSNSSGDQSTLSILPREIRDAIYTYAVAYDLPITIATYTTTRYIFKSRNKNDTIIRDTKFYEHPLLETCTSIYREAAPIFYANNSFRVDIPDGDPSLLIEWLSSTPASCLQRVRHLDISLNPNSIFDLQALRARNPGEGTTALVNKVMEIGLRPSQVTTLRPSMESWFEQDVKTYASGFPLGHPHGVVVVWGEVKKLRREWIGEFLQTWKQARRAALAEKVRKSRDKAEAEEEVELEAGFVRRLMGLFVSSSEKVEEG